MRTSPPARARDRIFNIRINQIVVHVVLAFMAVGLTLPSHAADAVDSKSAEPPAEIDIAGNPALIGGNVTFDQNFDQRSDPEYGATGPGVSRAVLEPAFAGNADVMIQSREIPSDLISGELNALSTDQSQSMSIARFVGDGAPTGPASLAELSRALRHDPDLIYEYVRNNIEFYPIWGVQKGALGTILDNQGTAFDQAALMVSLLRDAGYKASYIKGRISLTADQVRDWLGVPTADICGVLRLLSQGQIPFSDPIAESASNCSGSGAPLISVKVNHLWVKTVIGGVEYVFDPSFKPHAFKAGINLKEVSGYDSNAYLDKARSGATVNANFVKGINRREIRRSLNNYALSLTRHIREHLPASTLDDVIGGKQIKPIFGLKLRQTDLPYRDTSVAVTEWQEIPNRYRPTLRVQYQGMNKVFTSDAIYGKRLTITFNGANRPLLKLDGAIIATGTSINPGTSGKVVFTVTHGAYSHSINRTYTQTITAGGTFLIGNGWGPAGRGLVEFHRKRLDEAKAAGAADRSESVLGSTLAVLSASWIVQVNHSDEITDRLAGTNTVFHHQVGIAGYNHSAYVDLPGNLIGVVSETSDFNAEKAVFYSSAMHSSIFESTGVQQTTGTSAVSTVKLIDIAAAKNDKIFDARSSNYASAVKPHLVSCGAYYSAFQRSINQGRRLILPARCNIVENKWSGTGFFNVSPSSIGAIINGGLAGGFSSTPQPIPQTTANTLANTITPNLLTQSTGATFGDPIDMTKGHFLYSNRDLSIGVGGFPQSLSFERQYSSGSRNQDGPLGKGWTHSMDVSVKTGSDGFQGMGEDSALDAVYTLVEQMVSLDLLKDPAKPLDKMVIATIGQRWFGDHLINNTVIVNKGLNGEVFVKLPGANYNAPPGAPTKLIKNSNGSYSYKTLHNDQLDFNTAGQLVRYSQPSGIEVNYSYSGGKLTQVTNSLGRHLTLGYNGERISQVSDGSRRVKYHYDNAGNLKQFTDATNQPTKFSYDQPGRMTKLFNPGNPSISAATNTYDRLGRVKTQTNALGKTYTYYFAGSRSEEVGPGNVSKTSYVDAHGKILKSIDPLGRVVTNTYDGQTRLVKSVFPEGNIQKYLYDDAPCATQHRCTHNVKVLRQIPKPNSGLPNLTTRFTYHGTHNKVVSSTDANGQKTAYTYTPQGLPLTVTAPADINGFHPTTTYGYSVFSGFYLPTSITVNITNSHTVVNTTSYSAGNYYVPKNTIVDSGGGRLNLKTTYTYNAVGDLLSVNGPRADVPDITRYLYDDERRVIQTTDALGNKTLSAYDADGRLIRSASQSGSQWLVSCSTYTPTGKPKRQWGPALTASASTCPKAEAPVNVVDYVYDNLDRLTQTTQRLPASEGGSRITKTVYNKDNSTQRVRQAVGTAFAQDYAVYTYTPNGLQKTVQDARGNLTTYEYDGHDRLDKLRFPHPSQAGVSSNSDYEEYRYDNNGNPISIRKRNGKTVQHRYDDLNRIVARTYPDSADNLVFSYDLLGRRTQVKYANNSNTIGYTWDNAGRLLSTISGGKRVSYQYDAAGNRTRMDWPKNGFFTTTSYDALSRPLTIKEKGNLNLATYSYDDLSRRTRVHLGNGTTTSYGYDNQGALNLLSNDLEGSNADVTWRYSRNQAQDIVRKSWDNHAYLWTGFSHQTKNYSANGLNQYTSVAGKNISHDRNGNLTGDGVWNYTYDLDNRLRTAHKSGLSATLNYDATGRLNRTTIGTTTTTLLYDGLDLAAEYNASGVVQRRYVHGPGINEPLVVYKGSGTGNKQWLYRDHLGSIVATAGGNGVNTSILVYGPFGETDQSNRQRLGYTGQQYLSELGLYYYKARFYSADLGRFLQTDPIGYSDNLNLYAYVNNNAINYYDPSGYAAVQKGQSRSCSGQMCRQQLYEQDSKLFQSADLSVDGQLCAGPCIGGELELSKDYGSSTIIKSGFGLKASGGGGSDINIINLGDSPQNGDLSTINFLSGQVGPAGITINHYAWPDGSQWSFELNLRFPGGLGVNGGTGLKKW